MQLALQRFLAAVLLTITVSAEAALGQGIPHEVSQHDNVSLQAAATMAGALSELSVSVN